MEAKQNIYYALGILAYAIAKADGKVQLEEREKLFEIVKREANHSIDFQYAQIIFQILEKDKPGYRNTYHWAINELKKGRHYLSPEIKEKMIHTLKEIAMSFNLISEEEKSIINQFKIDLESIGSDHYLK